MPKMVRMHKMPNGKMMRGSMDEGAMESSMQDSETGKGEGPRKKSKKQVGYLLSSNYPLTAKEKAKMLKEMAHGRR